MTPSKDPQTGSAGPPPLRGLLWAAGGAAVALSLVFLVLGLRLTGTREPEEKKEPAPARPTAAPRPRPPERPAPASPASATELARETPPSAPDDLATEARAIERARDILAKGDALGAVYALNEYDEAYPNGAQRQESIALRVEALIEAGHPDTARQLATTFLRDFPASPHAARVKTLLGR